MSRFVIADVTDQKIVLQEIPHIANNIAVPIVPLLLEGSGREPTTLYDLRARYRPVLDTFWYTDSENLLARLKEKIIDPAGAKVDELLGENFKLLRWKNQ
jgi:hypothetical protein